jgi:hypothetical protein
MQALPVVRTAVWLGVRCMSGVAVAEHHLNHQQQHQHLPAEQGSMVGSSLAFKSIAGHSGCVLF